MVRRTGLGAGRGKGFKNIIPNQDRRTHSNSARGIKQPQRISPMIVNLRNTYQPQWSFNSRKSALEGLDFQKSVNPRTYNWLKNKEIKIKGKPVAVSELLKEQKKTTPRKSKGFFEF